MSRLHIQLVSAQLAGNLIPALMERPEHAALIVTPTMKRQASLLRELQEEVGIAVQTFEGAPDAELPRLHEFALEVVSALPEADEVVLNLTGGNKLMALGFLEMLRDTVHRRIYTDTAHGRLEHLPVGSERADPPTPLASVLDVPVSLRAQGFRYRSAVSVDQNWQQEANGRKQVAKRLAEIFRDDEKFLGAMNWLASKALDNEGRLVTHQQNFNYAPHSRRATHLGWLRDQGMLDWEGGVGITFLDEERTRYLNGGWLEEYVYHRLRDEGLDDVALGVEGTWDGTDGARNELDVVAAHANRVLVVECKTLNHERDHAVNDHQLYKLDSIGDKLRGFFGFTWMVCGRNPPDDMRKRARQHDIRLIGPDELPRLRKIVREWKAEVEAGG